MDKHFLTNLSEQDLLFFTTHKEATLKFLSSLHKSQYINITDNSLFSAINNANEKSTPKFDTSNRSNAVKFQKSQYRLIAHKYNDLLHLLMPNSYLHIAHRISNFILFSKYLYYFSVFCFVLYCLITTSKGAVQ